MNNNKYIKRVKKAGITASVMVPMVVAAAISSPAFAMSQTTTPQKVEVTKTDAEKLDQRITILKQKANTEIDKRVTSLSSLISKIDSDKRLTDDEKNKFKSDINKEIASLQTLKTKIASDTNADTLKADVKSIVESYRIYLLYLPKTRILIASNSLNTAADSLTEVATKLNTRIQQAKTDGKDVVEMQNLYTDLMNKIASAKKQYQEAENYVLNLTPDGYPGNKTSLESGRDLIKKGAADLKTAREDARKISAELKKLYPSTSTSPTQTPEV